MPTPLPPQHPERPLRLLALDGGGVRGLVTLYMLRRLMYLINSDNPPKPCDVFDVIAGTSTGGLIAIMLGRLEMKIQDAIDAYSDLSRRIFVPKSSIPVVCYVRNLFGGSTFNHKTLENAINGIVSTWENQDGATNEVQLLQQNPRCKIFVCTSMSNAYIRRLRSYHSRQEEHINCTIWEAARATSAAPLIFDPIKISNLEFRDGAFRENNPIFELLEEVSQEFPDRDIDTIVSLGTGVTSNIKLQNSLVKLAKSCAKIATDTETKANDFVKQHCGPGGRLRNKYFRFNVTQGLQGVGLEEWQAGDTMIASTMAYLNAPGTKEMLVACSERLKATPEGIPNSVVESIVQSNVTSEIRQTPTNVDPEDLPATFQQSTSLDLAPSPPSKRIRRFPRTQERREKVFQRLYFEDIDDRYSNIRLAHQDTCKWLLTNNQFRDWLDKKDHHAVLWLKGNPGTGKSTIMKFANLELGDLYPKDIHIHFFFNARGYVLARNTPGMYRSRLYQLLSSLPRLKEVIDDFGYHELAESENASWKIPQLQLILLRAIQELGRNRLWVLVDALDEGDESEICDMVNFFEQLGDEAKKNKVDMRVLVASRHYPRIIIPKSVEIRLDTEEGHSRDIERYIQTKLKVESNGTGEEIKEVVKSRASGVFLWVVLVVGILNKAAAHGMNQKAKLTDIPNDLSAVFKGILTRDLENSNSRGMQLCMQWVLFAWRPLSREELYFAIISGANEDELKSWKPDNITPKVMDNFILSCSRGLVQLSGTTFQFIHETVREFLLYGNGMQLIQSDSTQFLAGLSHDTLKSCCLSCITSTLDAAWAHGPPDLDDLDDPCRPSTSRVRYTRERYWRSKPKPVEKFKIPFLNYSLLYLLEHTNAAEAGGISQAMFLQKFERRHWLLLRMVFLDLETHISLDSTSLYTFAELNLGSLISGMLRDNPRLEFESGGAGSVILHHYKYISYPEYITANDSGSSPIVLALSKYRCDALLGFLSPGFTNGIENADDALFSAIKQLARTYILSSRSSQRNRETQILQFFFQWGGELDILTLLQSGRFAKDGNILVEMHCSLLSAAAERGYIDVVQYLLRDEDLNLDLQDNDLGLTPLSRACRNGHLPVVRLLVEDGRADINLGCRTSGKPPLAYAAENGKLSVVQILLDQADRNVDLRDKDGRTPLFHAARKGHTDIVSLLINTPGVNINSKDKLCQSVLSFATSQGHEDVIKLLLETRQVETNSVDIYGRTALSIAYKFKYHSVVQLLRAGLDIGMLDGAIGSLEAKGWAKDYHVTELWWAASQGNDLLVKELFDAGDIELNFRDPTHGRTPLWCAAEQGHEKVVARLLKQQGIDLESKDNEYGQTPVCVAARHGQKGVMRMLLAKGVVLKSADSIGRTPWIWAHVREDDSMKQMLEAQESWNELY